jgi:hypothetical protein
MDLSTCYETPVTLPGLLTSLLNGNSKALFHLEIHHNHDTVETELLAGPLLLHYLSSRLNINILLFSTRSATIHYIQEQPRATVGILHAITHLHFGGVSKFYAIWPSSAKPEPVDPILLNRLLSPKLEAETMTASKDDSDSDMDSDPEESPDADPQNPRARFRTKPRTTAHTRLDFSNISQGRCAEIYELIWYVCDHH